jgi:hypothetical protein
MEEIRKNPREFNEESWVGIITKSTRIARCLTYTLHFNE